MKKILIIKHGALGDWIRVTGAFKLIREHHPNDEITLLTNSRYVSMANQSPYFDDIRIDDRHGFFTKKTWTIISQLKRKRFDVVYDLQRSTRTSCYYKLIKRKDMYWSGDIKGCEGYFIDQPGENVIKRLSLQLKASGITSFPELDLSWLKADLSKLSLPDKFVVVVPGCTKRRSYKRWTPEGYAALIDFLAKNKMQSVLIGTDAEREMIEQIMENTKVAHPIQLINKLDFDMIAELGRHAQGAVGSDTGPMHILGPFCPSLVLFSQRTSPREHVPWGDKVECLQEDDLSNLPVDSVTKCFGKLIGII